MPGVGYKVLRIGTRRWVVSNLNGLPKAAMAHLSRPASVLGRRLVLHQVNVNLLGRWSRLEWMIV
jgi:hypothetical protein